MNINIYLEESLAKDLNVCAAGLGKLRNAAIREAIRDWVGRHRKKAWPKTVLNHKGISGIKAFESDRKDLMLPSEDPLS